ncbi:O-antigen ligase [Alkalibacterium sp. 20]|uniref:O-antigen ligase family protein n=1 Tax=Alkalibacterium sp. 20 TaxID=1798803 RepID=UPI0008FFE5DE|nr:O-antigen ligase family protein [Alkalibacterium sp. 20]OJF94714.1 hypothetical protein AX762_07110 [Alkalibacterium sp. 20]
MTNKKMATSLLFSFFVSLTLNLPSVKLFYSSALLNVIAFAGIFSVGFYRTYFIENDVIALRWNELKILFYFFLMWLSLLFVTWIRNPFEMNIANLIQYGLIIGFTAGIFFFLNKEDLPKIFIYQIIWGLFIAALEATIRIPKSRALGQHYLTSGVPIALTIVMLFAYNYYKRDIKTFIWSSPIFFVLFSGVTSLSGRSPIILSLLVPLLIVLFHVSTQRNLKKKLMSFVIVLISTAFIVYVLSQTLPPGVINRLIRVIADIESEPRLEVYFATIDTIIENPFGVGFNYTNEFDIFYPHNIFLEIILVGGVFALIPVSLLFFALLKSFNRIFRLRLTSVIWFGLLTFIFLTWNISFSLSSTYILFSAMAIYVKSLSEQHTM